MASKPVAVKRPADRCELCGYRSTGTLGDRIGHLRREHPVYARGLLLRMATPLVFLAAVLGLAALRAPQWTFLVALGGSLALMAAGLGRSRAERARAGARPGVPLGRLLREGGLRIVLLVSFLALLLILATRR